MILSLKGKIYTKVNYKPKAQQELLHKKFQKRDEWREALAASSLLRCIHLQAAGCSSASTRILYNSNHNTHHTEMLHPLSKRKCCIGPTVPALQHHAHFAGACTESCSDIFFSFASVYDANIVFSSEQPTRVFIWFQENPGLILNKL